MSDTNVYDLIDAECDFKKTIDFKVTNKAIVGVLLSLKFTNCGISLEADTKVADPLNPNSTIPVVGIFESIAWTGEPNDPIVIKGKVTGGNKNKFAQAFSSPDGGAEIEAGWCVYQYDDNAKKYFEHFHTDKKGLKFVVTRGTKFKLDQKKDETEHHAFEISLTAKHDAEKQEVCVATDANTKFTRKIGAEVTA